MSSPDDPLDEGWDDGPDGGDAGDDGSDDPGDASAGVAADAAPGTGEARRKRRRRRRKRRDHDAGLQARGSDGVHRHAQAQPHGHAQLHGQAQPQAQPSSQPQRQPPSQHDPQRGQGREQAKSPPRDARQRDPHGRGEQGHAQREPRGDRRDRDRGRRRDPRESRSAIDRGGEYDLRADDEMLRGDPHALGERSSPLALDARGSQPNVDDRGRHSQPTLDDEEPATETPAIAWGSEDDSPPPPVALAPDLPAEPPADDPDPLTYPLLDGPGAQLGDDVASVVGVRFVPAGRIQWCDAGGGEYAPGDRVLVDSDRGHRLAWIATVPTRRPVRDRNLRRVIRRATDADLRGERDGEAERVRALRVAKDVAASLQLPLKVFRVEKLGGKLNVYYTSDERLDLRDFVREVGQATGRRLELRQLGVRDEAKMVGGIGSCGLTLCCSTWLPEFVPVSIKMAKDQGLVLSPTKVSGQCGRLKCCLVYEQAGYAELRKGLPKLGKRVISPRGEGRVVEVDVLRQRVRVSYGPGDTEVLPATEVKPMFPSGNQPRGHEPPAPEDHDGGDEPGLPDS